MSCDLLNQLANLFKGKDRFVVEVMCLPTESYLRLLVAIPLLVGKQRKEITIDLRLSVNEVLKKLYFNGSLFGIPTTDNENFVNKLLYLISTTKETLMAYGWVVSCPSGVNINNLPKELELTIHAVGEYLHSSVEAKVADYIITLDACVTEMFNGASNV